MQVLLAGTGGASGWPEQGCRCASCRCAAAGGNTRAPSRTVVDGVLSLTAGEPPGAVDGYQVRAVPGGWDVTGPDGQRLLQAGGPGAVPRPPDGTAPYDVALLDLLGDPFQLGLLRARGLVTEQTAVAVAYADHRVPSSRELERRCGLWDVLVPRDGMGVTTSRSGEKKESKRPRRVLILGGARSGKSAAAEMRLAAEADVTYVATGMRTPAADDPEWAARVAAHRGRRPAWWRTVETTDLAGVLGTAAGALLVDGIGTWLAAALDEDGAWAGDPLAAGRLAERTGELIAAWRQTGAYVVAVSDETGLGVVPETASGRLFRDELGRLNQALAAESEETELVVAGLVTPLPLW
jgi:adenosylcobinamide kinase / adenosylcobinamide-phosphate guanylyltransferase